MIVFSSRLARAGGRCTGMRPASAEWTRCGNFSAGATNSFASQVARPGDVIDAPATRIGFPAARSVQVFPDLALGQVREDEQHAKEHQHDVTEPHPPDLR